METLKNVITEDDYNTLDYEGKQDYARGNFNNDKNCFMYYLKVWENKDDNPLTGIDKTLAERDNDPVNHPVGYTTHPSGIECIEVTRHMGFNIGNAIKYMWRCGIKPDADAIQDLEKARWYIDDEIKRLKAEKEKQPELQLKAPAANREGLDYRV